MDAQMRESSQSHHQPNLKRPWLNPNDTPKNHDSEDYSGRDPERAREHLRAGYLQGIINPEKNGYGREGSPQSKRFRSSNGGDGLERHIFPRFYATQGDPILREKTPAHDSRRVFLQTDSSQNTTKSSSPSGSIGSNEQPASVQETNEVARGRQHKSFLITNSPGSLIGPGVTRESSQSNSFQPAVPHGKSHDMHSECNPLLQEVAVGLSKLASIMLTGKTPEAERDHHLTKDDCGEGSISAKCPDVAQLGMKETLRWMLNVIQSTTCLAQATVQRRPGASLENESTAPTTSGHRPNSSEGSLEIMKRRFLDDEFRRQHPDPALEENRRSQDVRDPTSRDYMRTIVSKAEEFPSMGPQSPFSPAFPPTSFGGRAPAMNPPPTPNRPLPISPPGPRVSPTIYNLPSPASNSASTQSSNPTNLPSLHSLSSSSLGNLLHHPMSPPSSIDAATATNAHTAALQHDVSIRTLALQSLQLEHNNLLAAFSRSQTRAAALEKKHMVSDAEINSLSEERTRLQIQVSELEQSVEELSRSRDDARLSAVQEGAQYVQMIKMAGQLEEKGREERRAWERLKKDMEDRIEGLLADAAKTRQQQQQQPRHQQQQSKNNEDDDDDDDGGITTTKDHPPKIQANPPRPQLPTLQRSENTPPSSAEAATAISIPTTTSSPSNQPAPNTDILIADLRKQIQNLKKKCAVFEQTLLAVRSESRQINVVVEALGRAGRRIREGIDGVVGDGGGGVDGVDGVGPGGNFGGDGDDGGGGGDNGLGGGTGGFEVEVTGGRDRFG